PTVREGRSPFLQEAVASVVARGRHVDGGRVAPVVGEVVSPGQARLRDEEDPDHEDRRRDSGIQRRPAIVHNEWLEDVMRHALALSLLVVLSGCWDDPQKKPVASKEPAAAEVTTMTDYSKLTDADWKARLTEEQYEVTRHKGTERAGSGCYAHSHEPGTYLCVCCGQPLFKSETKFESGTGWPSFWQPVDKGAVKEIEDRSYG